MRILFYVKLQDIHLFFDFQVFFVLYEISHMEISFLIIGILCIKIRFISIHIFCIINYLQVIFVKFDSSFLDTFINFCLNIGFVSSISCACKTLFIVFLFTFTPKFLFNIFTKKRQNFYSIFK